MKKTLLLLGICFLAMSCDTTSPEEKIANLNGYWQIKTAERPSENPREYRFSELVDYIQVEEKEGFRKKAKPQLDGTYVVSEDEEQFSIKIENDSINFYYETPYSTWKETLLSSSEDEIEVLNQYGIKYTYERFTPYLDDYGQEEE